MTSRQEILIREAVADDQDQILDLLRSALGKGSVPRSAEFWQWKHRANPFGSSPAWVALVDGRIVGLRTFLRWRWRLESSKIDAVRAVDTATHPDWQRRGIFWRLTRESLDQLTSDGCAFVFNTPNRRSGAGYRKLGWRAALKPAIYIRALRPLRMAGAAIRADQSRSPADLTSLPSIRKLFRWAKLTSVLEEHDRDLRKRLHTLRDRDYLRWRYAQIPGVDYRSLWGTKGDASAAIIFRTRMRRSMREVLISEILGCGDQPVRQRIFESLFARLRAESDADYLVAAAPNGSPDAGRLKAAGFKRTPSGPSLMIRPLTGRLGDAALASDRWQLSIGDLEIF